MVVWGTEATGKNSVRTEKDDATLARERLKDACALSEHLQTIATLHNDSGNTEALWLLTSESIARALGFDTRVGADDQADL